MKESFSIKKTSNQFEEQLANFWEGAPFKVEYSSTCIDGKNRLKKLEWKAILLTIK